MPSVNASRLTDFLTIDYKMAGVDPEEREVRLQTRIVEIPDNLFHKPIPGEGRIKHFKMEIYPEEKWLDVSESEKPGEWEDIEESIAAGSARYKVRPLPFHMTTYGTPTIERFSSHVYQECFAALFAVYQPKRDGYCNMFRFESKEDIAMEDVWVYLKLHNKHYESTTDFIRDYWYWHDRLYQTQKWFHYLMGDIRGRDGTRYSQWDFPVGENLLEFISPDDYPQEINTIRSAFPE